MFFFLQILDKQYSVSGYNGKRKRNEKLLGHNKNREHSKLLISTHYGFRNITQGQFLFILNECICVSIHMVHLECHVEKFSVTC